MELSKLPQVVKILGKKYKLEWVNEPDNEDSAGQCHQPTQTIKVDVGFHADMVQDTLLHEIVHAIDDELNLKMTERQVNNLATTLLGVMKDNAKVRNFIFGGKHAKAIAKPTAFVEQSGSKSE